jgi:threonine dehydratase
MSTHTVPSFADIEAAAARIAPFIARTPLLESAALNERVGGRMLLKPESLQRGGAFKIRGALNKMLQIAEDARANGVVAFSSGNHAQGVALAAKLLGMRALIVMPADAPRIKIENTRGYGADVVLYDRYTEDREAIAARICAERGATLVKPFDDADIVAGQGTIGLEIAQDAKALGIALDLALSPCGGGGLVSGIALALSQVSPHTQVVGVEPENFDGMRRSLAAGARTAAPAKPASLADALMAPMPGVIPFALAHRYVRQVVTVSDAELADAVRYAFLNLKLVVEPGGAAALAALLSGKIQLRGKTAAVILSGGNCDPETLMQCLEAAPSA